MSNTTKFATIQKATLDTYGQMETARCLLPTANTRLEEARACLEACLDFFDTLGEFGPTDLYDEVVSFLEEE